MSRRPSFLRRYGDLLGAVALVLLCGFAVSEGEVEELFRTPRFDAFRKLYGSLGAMEGKVPPDLVVLGDSRSWLLPPEVLARNLGRPVPAVVNASLMAGDWATSWVIYRRLRSFLDADSVVLVCVSEFWLDGQEHFGMLPNTPEYWELGQPLRAVSSYLPLATVRHIRVDHARALAADLAWSAAELLDGVGRPPERPPDVVGPEPSDVESARLWFVESDRDMVRRKRRMARRFLQMLAADGRPVVVAFLPNAPARDAFVDAQLPGRRQRFHDEIREMVARHGFPYVDLSGEMATPRFYKDAHHLNLEGVEEACAYLAAALYREGLPR